MTLRNPVGKSRRALLVILGAWLLQVTAWFSPVVTGIWGGSINPIPGWTAFVASAVALRGDSGFFGEWYVAALATAGAATTVFFIFGSPWIVFRGSPSLCRRFAWTVAAAFILNAHWYFLSRPNGFVSNLGTGYFLWWCSYLVLAIGLFDLASAADAIEPAKTDWTFFAR